MTAAEYRALIANRKKTRRKKKESAPDLHIPNQTGGTELVTVVTEHEDGCKVVHHINPEFAEFIEIWKTYAENPEKQAQCIRCRSLQGESAA